MIREGDGLPRLAKGTSALIRGQNLLRDEGSHGAAREGRGADSALEGYLGNFARPLPVPDPAIPPSGAGEGPLQDRGGIPELYRAEPPLQRGGLESALRPVGPQSVRGGESGGEVPGLGSGLRDYPGVVSIPREGWPVGQIGGAGVGGGTGRDSRTRGTFKSGIGKKSGGACKGHRRRDRSRRPVV